MVLDLIRHVSRLVLLSTAAMSIGSVYAQAPAKDALLIAVNQYEHPSFSELQYAEDDAKSIGKVLKENGYNVELLTGSGATNKAIVKALESCSKRGANKGVLLIGIFGHGIEFSSGAKSYYCPYDVEVGSVRDADGKLLNDATGKPLVEPKIDTLVPIDEFLAALQSTKAAQKVLIADCCRNDPNQARSRSFGSSLATNQLPTECVVLFACSSGQRAFEHKSWGHGALTKCFLDSISKNSSMLKVVEEVTPAVEKLCESTSGIDAKQTPRFLVTGAVDLKLSIASPKKKTKPKELVVPFTESQASEAQNAWAEYYEIPKSMTNSLGMKFQLVPPGKFVMGSNEPNPSKNETPHTVTITRPFYVCEHETTVGQFRKFIEETKHRTGVEQGTSTSQGWDTTKGQFTSSNEFRWNNTGWKQTDDHPVVNVAWLDCVAFVGWLNSKEESRGYRLLTEAEWEYCCRAGSNKTYYCGDDKSQLVKYGNVLDSSGWKMFATDTLTSQKFQQELIAGNDGVAFTAKVGSYLPNAFKLYDFHGNVCEFCQDIYSDDYYLKSDNVRDPMGASPGLNTLYSARGGRFDTGERLARVYSRNRGTDKTVDMILGFRIMKKVEDGVN